MSQSLILTDALSSAFWEKKKIKKEKLPGGFFPRARHDLLAVLHGIFVAVSFN
jgi:hypothetical protein